MATEIKSELTGSIWKIEASVDQTVEEYDVLIIIESMKMESPVQAPCDGKIIEIRVKEGDQIEEGDVLAVIG